MASDRSRVIIDDYRLIIVVWVRCMVLAKVIKRMSENYTSITIYNICYLVMLLIIYYFFIWL